MPALLNFQLSILLKIIISHSNLLLAKKFRRYQTLTKRVVQIADSRYKDINILRAEELSLLDNFSINFYMLVD